MRTMTSKEIREALWPNVDAEEALTRRMKDPPERPTGAEWDGPPPFMLDERVCCAATGHEGTVVHLMPPAGGSWIVVVRLDSERRTALFSSQSLERAPELRRGLEEILEALAAAGLDGAKEHLEAERAALRARSVVTEAREQIAKLPRQQRRRLQRKAKR